MTSAELDRAAAACLLASFPDRERPPEWIRRWLERGLGGVVLFAANTGDGLRELTAALRAERPELLVATDEEGGDVTRLEAARGSSYPGNLALGAVDDTALTREVAGAIAGDLARAGVTMNLAPVADTNTNPANPVIGVRSFGAEPELVARHVAAFVEGTQRLGVAACAKHFPGHGDTRADSHLELPTVEAGPDELRSGALVPFRAAIAAGVRAVMTGHLAVPALDSAPATLSRAVVAGLLRGELGFDGLVVSDALDMRAVAGTTGVEDGAVRALAAGVDALCLGPTLGPEAVERVHGAIVAAVRSERLAADRLAEAASRVEETARWASAAGADGAPDRGAGSVAAARAVRARGNVDAGARPFVVELVPEPSIAAGAASYAIGDAVRTRRPGTRAVRLREPTADLRRLLRGAGDDRVVLVLRDATRHPWQQAAARDLLAARPDTVVVELGLPGRLPEGAAASIETHGAGRVNLEAAAALLAPPA